MTGASAPALDRAQVSESLIGNSEAAMFAAIEIHNKPIFPYRYEVCTLLVINAWELVLKAFIAKELKNVKLLKDDGTTKPFSECVACVSSHLGKQFEHIRHNIELVYEYRNKVAHFYPGDIEVVVLGYSRPPCCSLPSLLRSILESKLHEKSHLVLLPIGFTKLVSPLDFISNDSASKGCSPEVKNFLQSVKASCESLDAQGIQESVVINYSIALVNETRIKNADLTAAIGNSSPQQTFIAVQNVITSANISNDPAAKQIRIEEESIYSTIFTETYNDVVKNARQRFSNFLQNDRFNSIMKKLKKDPNLRRTRLLNPSNPDGGSKDFYSKRIYEELAKSYKS